MSEQSERFNTERPGLCSALHWKRQYIWSEPDPTVPACNDGLFWCGLTQAATGPDGKVAEPGNCCSTDRGCHCDNEK
ncbi:MAG TPA: hypothetical protein VI685_06310 [Candidatus Angelobacter sp.]